jgi:hypothetical protein
MGRPLMRNGCSKFRAFGACVILRYMSEHPSELESWAGAIRRRGLTDVAHLLLNVLEPVGPLGAQALWAFQPLLGLFGWKQVVGELAQTLEQPGGVDLLRRQLSDDHWNQDQ